MSPFRFFPPTAQESEESTVAEKAGTGSKDSKTESKKLQLMVESIKRKTKALDSAAPGKRQRKA